MAAEFFGHCQICGRQQKAHPHAIAKHGYTIRDGWQEGACFGSGGKPYEISCDLIEGAIASAERFIIQANTKIEAIKADPLHEGGTVQVIRRKTLRNGELAYPINVTVKMDDKRVIAVDSEGAVFKEWQSYDGVKTVEAAVKELADAWIKRQHRHIAQAKMSLEYMGERLKNWKPADLKPVTAADRAKDAAKIHFHAKKQGSAVCAVGYKHTTDDRTKVTCAACLKELARIDDLPRLKAEKAEKERLSNIKSAERDIKEYTKLIKRGGTESELSYWNRYLTEAANTLAELKAAAPAAQ